MPHFAYARSDKKDHPRISIGGRLMADMLVTAGANRILTMTLHAPQVHAFFRIPTDQLHALEELASHFRVYDLSNTTVVSPDLGNAKSASKFARLLGTPVAAGAKDQEAGKAFIKWLASAEAADAANNAASAPFIAANSAASTAKYGALQKKSVEVVQNAKSIAQFLDRDTNADLANTVITASLQEFIKKPDSIDAVTTSIQQQAKSILG